MATYSIKDLEKISGIKSHTIRIWEKRYNLINPKRTQTNIRFYSDADLRKLLNIAILVRNGIKISKIATFKNEDLGEKVLLVSQKLGKVEDTLENLILAMIEVNEDKFERQLSDLIIKLGFEAAFTKYLQPFFERVGVLWQTGTIVPAQEHFVSNLIRQKIIVGIDTHRQTEIKKQTTFVLFLPEGEFHELGLLFMQYILRKRNYKTLYFGQSVPVADLVIAKEILKEPVIICNISTPVTNKKSKDFITNLTQLFHEEKIIITGSQLQSLNFEMPSNIQKINSYAELIDELDNFQ
jgi:DNA-binding transcriptional MerR regulator